MPIYETREELLEKESNGWVAVAIMGRPRGRVYAYVVGPHRTELDAKLAAEMIRRNHRHAARKNPKGTNPLLVVEVKPIWREPAS